MWGKCGARLLSLRATSVLLRRGWDMPGKKQLSSELIASWHPTLNDRAPSAVSGGSSYRAWWKCPEGHEWQARVDNRGNGAGCPYCAGKKPVAGENDLATTHPELAQQWHERNATAACEVLPFSNKKVWWQCPEGHEWEAVVANRSKGAGCPFCSGNRPVLGQSDLQTTHPRLAAEWAATGNDRLPSEVSAGSDYVALWVCDQRHEWYARVFNRARGGRCPICVGTTVLAGLNDLATLNPELSAEWHTTRNKVAPSEVLPFSSKKVWWQCAEGHEWEAKIANRSLGRGCPICGGRQALAGFNDLVTVRPDLAEEWHPTRNTSRPEDHRPGSNSLIWWQCPDGHEWKAQVNTRTSGRGCPTCSGQTVSPGHNDLLSQRPEVASRWHQSRNSRAPTEVTVNSGIKVWWQCLAGHEWEATVASQSRGGNCPSCAQYGFRPEAPAEFYWISNESLSAQKVGVSGGSARRKDFQRLGWSTLGAWSFSRGAEALRVERLVLTWIRVELQLPIAVDAEQMPIGGHTETFPTRAVGAGSVQSVIEAAVDVVRRTPAPGT